MYQCGFLVLYKINHPQQNFSFNFVEGNQRIIKQTIQKAVVQVKLHLSTIREPAIFTSVPLRHALQGTTGQDIATSHVRYPCSASGTMPADRSAATLPPASIPTAEHEK